MPGFFTRLTCGWSLPAATAATTTAAAATATTAIATTAATATAPATAPIATAPTAAATGTRLILCLVDAERPTAQVLAIQRVHFADGFPHHQVRPL